MKKAISKNETLPDKTNRRPQINPTQPGNIPEFYRLLDKLPAAAYICDSEGFISYFNRHAVALWGREPKLNSLEDRYCGSFKLFLPDGSPLAHEECWMARALREDREYNAYEVMIERPNGSRCIALAHANPFHHESGEVSGAVNILVDITDQKETEEQFRTAVEAAPNAMIIVDQQGKIRLVNSQTELLFGYSRDELIGHPMEMLVPERYRQSHPNYRTGFSVSPHARPMGAGRDLYGRRKDGQEVAVEIGLNPLLTAEGAFVLASIIDITERKRAEEQIKASLLEKEVLLKEIHHRVKNNLQLVSSLLQLQSGYIQNPEMLGVFQESENRIRSIAMIHEKLYQSKSLAKVDFAEYISSLVAMLLHTYSNSGSAITLQIEVAPMSIGIDVAVPVGLILNELLTNILKYAFPGGRSGSITIAMVPTLAERFILTVADDGIGFPDTVLPETTSSLGLRLVKILTKQLGGESTFRTGPTGTVFSFTFPYTK